MASNSYNMLIIEVKIPVLGRVFLRYIACTEA